MWKCRILQRESGGTHYIGKTGTKDINLLFLNGIKSRDTVWST